MKVYNTKSSKELLKKDELFAYRKANKDLIEDYFRSLPETLEPVSDFSGGEGENTVCEWRSKYYQVSLIAENHGIYRIKVNRTIINDDGDYIDGLTWDDLMEVKRQIGLGEFHAVEVLPADRHVVYSSNVRHIWILPEPIVGWFTKIGLEKDTAEKTV